MSENSVSRRDFLKLALLGVGAASAEVLLPKSINKLLNPENNQSDLVFSDEFKGGSINTQKWIDSYPGGLRTHGEELQTYVPFSEGHHVVENGILHLTAQKEGVDPKLPYKSAMITGKTPLTYGVIEARIKPPKGAGLWPAFWLLPESGKWPPEIDIGEFLGGSPSVIHGANHIACNFPDSGNFCDQYENFDHTNQKDLTKDFHNYKLVWLPKKMYWFLDNKMIYESKDERVPNVPMFPILNLAVGGWAGTPDAATKFPASFDIDYFRAWSLPKNSQTL